MGFEYELRQASGTLSETGRARLQAALSALGDFPATVHPTPAGIALVFDHSPAPVHSVQLRVLCDVGARLGLAFVEIDDPVEATASASSTALDAARNRLRVAPDDGVVARRNHPPPSQPVALLASFTRPEQLIVPLWAGVNRVGHRPPLSDYAQQAKGTWFESRQWLITIHDDVVLVTDDRTTNQSHVVDPLGVIHPLDWFGTAARLQEGSTLHSAYAGFAFGWLETVKT